MKASVFWSNLEQTCLNGFVAFGNHCNALSEWKTWKDYAMFCL